MAPRRHPRNTVSRAHVEPISLGRATYPKDSHALASWPITGFSLQIRCTDLDWPRRGTVATGHGMGNTLVSVCANSAFDRQLNPSLLDLAFPDCRLCLLGPTCESGGQASW